MIQFINTRMNTETVLTANASVPLGAVVHKNGCDIKANTNTFVISGAGFYRITANLTIEPTVAGEMDFTMLNNGNIVTTQSGTVATAGDNLNIVLDGVVYNKCNCNDSVIAFVVGAGGNVLDFDVIIERM